MTPQSSPVPVYGGDYRGKCPVEEVELASFFNRLRLEYPDTYGLLGLHIRNEGKRTAMQMRKIKADGGFVKGAVDIVIPGSPCMVMEMKRLDPTLSKWETGQREYLSAAAKAGAFACVAFGAVNAWAAFEEWIGLQNASVPH